MTSSTSPDPDQPDTIVGISFDDVYRSQEFLTAVTRLNANGSLKLLDAVVVSKDADGKTRVRETVDLQPGRAALSGAVWTGLLGLIIGGPVGWIAGLGVGAGAGALTAKVVDVGVADEWVAWFRDAVDPHTFTVVVLASGVDVDALVGEAGRFDGAHLVYANMDRYAIARIQRALGNDVEVPEAGTGTEPDADPPANHRATPVADSDRVAGDDGAASWPPPVS